MMLTIVFLVLFAAFLGKLSLVDLAGSERWDKVNLEGLKKEEKYATHNGLLHVMFSSLLLFYCRESMAEEGKAINKSLSVLKRVFAALGAG